jgi:DNA-binding transcriptional ArsR family regulator
MAENTGKPSRHICLTNRNPLGITDDPELEILTALADKDVLTMARGLAKEEARSPFPDGLFGLDYQSTTAAIRRMKAAGLISSRRDGDDHVYFLNAPRFRDLERFIETLIGPKS